jgi:NADH-quinone oxidoreductase subunit C
VSTLERVQAALSGLNVQILASRDETPHLSIEPADVREACRRLRDQAGFETNTFVTAIDHYPAEPRFQVCYQFLSVRHNDRVRLSARLAGEGARIDTIADLWPGAQYAERECFDMFGIVFAGHRSEAGELKRLLMPEDYDHYPLRKDFPHQGLEPDKLYNEWFNRRFERHERQHADV